MHSFSPFLSFFRTVHEQKEELHELGKKLTLEKKESFSVPFPNSCDSFFRLSIAPNYFQFVFCLAFPPPWFSIVLCYFQLVCYLLIERTIVHSTILFSIVILFDP